MNLKIINWDKKDNGVLDCINAFEMPEEERKKFGKRVLLPSATIFLIEVVTLIVTAFSHLETSQKFLVALVSLILAILLMLPFLIKGMKNNPLSSITSNDLTSWKAEFNHFFSDCNITDIQYDTFIDDKGRVLKYPIKVISDNFKNNVYYFNNWNLQACSKDEPVVDFQIHTIFCPVIEEGEYFGKNDC